MFNGEVRQYDELKKEETGMMKPKSFIKNKTDRNKEKESAEVSK